MKNNIEEVAGRLAEIEGVLAEIFYDVARALSEEIIGNENWFDEPETQRRRRRPSLGTRAGNIVDKRTEGRPINVFPGGIPGGCYPLCVCKAFGKWNSRKEGFKGVAEYLINDYFVKCGKINKAILILTFAWDTIDFNELFKKAFDDYTRQGKTIIVILVTEKGLSIQYLR